MSDRECRECIDTNLGALLHAYELNSLSEEDAERFEIHLLKCGHCFHEIKAFESNVEMLKTDGAILEKIWAVSKESEVEVKTPSLAERIWHNLWPESPLVLRPAFMFLIILLLIYPAYLGLNPAPDEGISTISTINLFPGRSAGAETYKVNPGENILLNFIFRDADPGKEYIVKLSDIGGQVLLFDKSFTGFDDYGMGCLLVPAKRIKPGIYILAIDDPEDSSPEGSLTYRFKIDI